MQPDFFAHHFLPNANQIYIRTSKFRRKFTANKSAICRIFVEKAELNSTNFFNPISMKELKTVNEIALV